MIENPAPDKITIDLQAPRVWPLGDSPHTRYVHRWRPWPAWVWTCPCCKMSGHHSIPPSGTHDARVDHARGRRHAFARAWRAAEFHLWKYHKA